MSVDTDHYHCYSCGAHGDVIDFIEKTQGLTKRTAIEAAAMLYNVDPEQTDDIIYPYTDEAGKLLYEVVRKPGKKFFRH